MAKPTIAERKAAREETAAAKKGGTGTKEAKVPVRQRAGGATHKAWGSTTNPGPKPATIDPNDRRFLKRQFKRRASKVLFFVKGAIPSGEDFLAAQAIGPGCVFRNVLKIVPGAPLENCDAVAGEVPEDYAALFPTAEIDHAVDETDTGIGEHVIRPERTHPGSSGNAPDDVRPGTVGVEDPETGKPVGFGSGTGSSQSGGVKPNQSFMPDGKQGTTSPPVREQAAVWKSNKVEGASE